MTRGRSAVVRPAVFAVACLVSWSLFFLIYRLAAFDGAVDYDRYKRLPLFPIDFLRQAPPPPPPERPDRPRLPKRPQSPSPEKLVPGVPQPKLNVGTVPVSDLTDTAVGVYFDVGGEAVPLVRTNPIYPIRAARRGTEGWVEIEFAITEDGGVDSARVVESNPPSVFDSAALRAVSKWRYRPQTISGKAVRREGERIVIEFRLER